MSDDDDLPPFLQRLVEWGRREGHLRGELDAKRDTMSRLLSRLGVALTPEQSRRVEECRDPATLDRWIGNLVFGKTGADFFD
jgi:hypothetical protein